MPWSDEGIGVNVGGEISQGFARAGNPDQSFQSGDLTGQGAPTLPVSGNFRVLELFGEMQVPIIRQLHSSRNSRSAPAIANPGTSSRTTASTTRTLTKSRPNWRRSRMSDFAVAITARFALPNIQELFAPQFVGLDGSNDPCAGQPVEADDFGCLAQGLCSRSEPDPEPSGSVQRSARRQPEPEPGKGDDQDGRRGAPAAVHSAPGVHWSTIGTSILRTRSRASVPMPSSPTASRTQPPPKLLRHAPWFIATRQGLSGSLRVASWKCPEQFGSDQDRRLGFQRLVQLLPRRPRNLSASFNGTYLHKYRVNNGVPRVAFTIAPASHGSHLQQRRRCQFVANAQVEAQGTYRAPDAQWHRPVAAVAAHRQGQSRNA